jgi:hypothetical protein
MAMRALKLVVFGAVGALGVLRGLEVLFTGHDVVRAAVPLALGIFCIALFFKELKNR